MQRAVGAVLFDPRGRILLVQRGRPPARGTWSLPGGRIAGSETGEEAVIREVREETHLEVRMIQHLTEVTLRVGRQEFLIAEYLCALRDPLALPSPGDDARAAAFVAIAALESLGTTPLVREVIELGRVAWQASSA